MTGQKQNLLLAHLLKRQFFTCRISSHDFKTTKRTLKPTGKKIGKKGPSFNFNFKKGDTYAELMSGISDHAKI